MPGFGPEAHIWSSLNQYRFCISLSSSLRHWKLNSTIFLSCLCCAVKTDMYYSLWWTCCFLHIHFYINLAQIHSPTYSTNSRHASVTELKWKIAYRPSAWKSMTKNYPFEFRDHEQKKPANNKTGVHSSQFLHPFIVTVIKKIIIYAL